MIIKLYDVQEFWYSSGIGIYPLDANTVVNQIESAPEDEEIDVRINSCGGFVFDGFAIYNALKAHKGNVITQCEGIAASIASIIFMAGKERRMAKGSMLMIHKPFTYVGEANADQLQKDASALNKIQDVMASIYGEPASIEEDAITAMINEETWLKPDEALQMGFATHVTSLEEKPVIAQNKFNHLFKNSNAGTRLYANSIFNIKKEDMSTETAEMVKNTNSFLKTIGNKFEKIMAKLGFKNATSTLEDDSVVYYDGELAIGTEVFTDEEMTEHVSDGSHTLKAGGSFTTEAGLVTAIVEAEEEAGAEDNVDLEAENASLKAELESLKSTLAKANTTLEALAKIQSNGDPEKRVQNFKQPKNNNEKTLEEVREERKAAREKQKIK